MQRRAGGTHARGKRAPCADAYNIASIIMRNISFECLYGDRTEWQPLVHFTSGGAGGPAAAAQAAAAAAHRRHVCCSRASLVALLLLVAALTGSGVLHLLPITPTRGRSSQWAPPSAGYDGAMAAGSSSAITHRCAAAAALAAQAVTTALGMCLSAFPLASGGGLQPAACAQTGRGTNCRVGPANTRPPSASCLYLQPGAATQMG